MPTYEHLMQEGVSQQLAAAVRRPPIRAIWLGCQAALAGFGIWATASGTPGDIWIPISILIGILLLPGVVPVLAAVIALSAALHSWSGVALLSDAFFLLIVLVSWVSSAWLTDLFWRMLLSKRSNGGGRASLARP